MSMIAKVIEKSIAFFSAKTHKPAPAGASPDDTSIRMLLLHLCNGDAERATWIMRWLAYPMRHPGAKMESALVVDGAGLSGEHLFFSEIIAPMHGQHARHERLDVTFKQPGRSAGWTRGARYVVVDDFVSTRQANMALKSLMLTSILFVVNAYNKPETIANELNFVFLSGDLASFKYDRRFYVIEPAKDVDNNLLRHVLYSIENGGLVDFYTHLMTGLDMGDFNERTPIDNRSNAGEVSYA